jgi:hypothetical protein
VRAAPDLLIPVGAISYWSCGPGGALTDRVRGTIGAVVYRIGEDVAELLLCLHLTRLGGAQCVGVRLGPAGAFSALDQPDFRPLVENAAILTSTTQRCAHGELEALASFGRDPARFLLRSAPGDQHQTPVGAPAVLMTKPQSADNVVCLSVCRLENRTAHSILHLERAALAQGEMRAAVALSALAPGRATYWSCGAPSLRGKSGAYRNEGCLVYSVWSADSGQMLAEVALLWRCPFAMTRHSDTDPARFGIKIGPPNSFTQMTNEHLYGLSAGAAPHATVGRDGYNGLHGAAIAGTDPAIFLVDASPCPPRLPLALRPCPATTVRTTLARSTDKNARWLAEMMQNAPRDRRCSGCDEPPTGVRAPPGRRAGVSAQRLCGGMAAAGAQSFLRPSHDAGSPHARLAGSVVAGAAARVLLRGGVGGGQRSSCSGVSRLLDDRERVEHSHFQWKSWVPHLDGPRDAARCRSSPTAPSSDGRSCAGLEHRKQQGGRNCSCGRLRAVRPSWCFLVAVPSWCGSLTLWHRASAGACGDGSGGCRCVWRPVWFVGRLGSSHLPQLLPRASWRATICFC